MENSIRRSAERWWTAAVLAAMAAAGAVLTLAGGTVWVLAAAAALFLAAGVSAWAGWTLGVAAAVIGPLAVEAYAVRVFHKIGLDLATGNALTLLAIALAGFALLTTGPAFRLPRPSAWWGLLASAALPAVVGAFFAALPFVRNGHALSWAMQNDAVWNLVTSRFLVSDHGFIPSLHPNASPLTAILLAAGMAPGRAGVAATDLLQHDLAAMAGVFAASTVVAAVLAGLTVARAVSPGHPVLRTIGAVLASALILSWFAAGFSFQFGFYNVMPTIACLLACWLAWLGSPRAPVAAIVVLLAAATVLLALWAFLALLPLALAAAAGVRWLLGRPGWSWSAWAPVILAAAQLLAYVVFFSIPDLRREQGALAQGGSMAPVTPALLFTLIGLAVAVAAATATVPAARVQLVGVLAVSLAAVAAYLVLATQVGPDAGGWGYYPAKLVWFGSMLLMVVVLGMALDRIGRAPLARWPRTTAVLGSVTVLVALAAGVLPKSPTTGALVPYLDIARGTGIASGDAVLPTLFALDDPAEARTMLVGYFDWKADGFANLWLLGASATLTSDPIRSSSYSLNTTDLDQVCAAIATWDGEVVVRTTQAGLQQQLRARCPEAKVRVLTGPIAGT